jgi:GT2 family glycosyltransferase
VERIAPQARVLHNPENFGWSGGNNTALRVALQESCEHAVLLNVNALPEPTWLSALMQAAARSPELHILQSVILLHGTDRLNSFGNRLHYLGYGYCNGYGQPQDAPHRRLVMDFASGASMLVRREVFDRVGLFREDYFLYYDDVEFSWRARLAGFNVGMAEQSVCFHKYDFQNTLRFLDCLQRNRLMTLLTLEKLRTIAVILPCLLLAEAAITACLVARGQGGVQWRLMKYFLRPATWRTIRERRRDIRRLRVRPDAEVVRRFAGAIAFPELNQPLLRYLVNPLLRLYWALARLCILW